MTDKEIIKAFECCGSDEANCKECPLRDDSYSTAIKEFAERLLDKSIYLEDDERYYGYAVKTKDIKDLVKEMTEGSDGKQIKTMSFLWERKHLT